MLVLRCFALLTLPLLGTILNNFSTPSASVCGGRFVQTRKFV
jgi:hypothetical protein